MTLLWGRDTVCWQVSFPPPAAPVCVYLTCNPCVSAPSSAGWGKVAACLPELLWERRECSCVRPFRDARHRVRAQGSGPC